MKIHRNITAVAFVAALSAMPSCANAQAKVVLDAKTIEAVTQNTEAVRYIEQLHNNQLDSIKSKELSMAGFAATMALLKENYRMSMQNVNSFRENSVYYKEMANQFAQIPGNIVKASKAMLSSPGMNFVSCLQEITGIQLETASVVQTFLKVVANGKVSLKDFKNSKNSAINQLLGKAKISEGDGYNFLDRYTRLQLCCELIGEITSINRKLEQITYICSTSKNASTLVFNIDPDTWINYMTGKNIIDGLVNSFKYGGY